MPSSASASMLSHANTMHSIGNQIGYKVRNIAHLGQPTIDIDVHGSDGRNAFLSSFSTMDTVQGNVTITAPYDTRFNDVDIAFVGISQVFVDRLTTTPTMTGRTEAAHRFLLLRQPMDESDFPSPRVLEAGKSYKFPFTFTIPSQLLPKACTHKTVSDHVRNTHLQLPPSLGDPDLAGFGGTLLDDSAPQMSKITYGIKVRVAHARGSEGISILAEKMKKVRVKPAFDEQAPLNVDNMDEYRPRQEKKVKKGLFKGKLGTLIAKTVQPKPLVIPTARSTDKKPITTMAKLVLRFDPADESNTPPKLGSLATKIKISTYFASAPRQNFPSRSALGSDLSQGFYSENINLSNLCIASAQWEKFDCAFNPSTENLVRRDSGISDCSAMTDVEKAFAAGILPASKDYKHGSFYTTQILVPITPPMNKNFIPTFHSCLISRTYTLSLQFSLSSGPSMHLKIPVQICAEGSDTGIENARARSVEETVFREAADVFLPRSVAPPSFDGRRNGSVEVRDELPPDYAAFAAPAARYHARLPLVT
ncbi:arrestin [Cucurbitaria berberidis CBS 394.84]|uniref:Arrestin n=1 Tax=Cucurbitaria berberidis CBS 394.84 TaxID=1168544 RepID=A0A9P4LE22_9PLEO|nr:arrestin [Cucurbitaria berberidis CBS 394.84]KAF1851393.1 arrestin [Cucurbitaria berberidis CBS 394.84]